MFSTKIAGNGMEDRQVGVKKSDGTVIAKYKGPTETRIKGLKEVRVEEKNIAEVGLITLSEHRGYWTMFCGCLSLFSHPIINPLKSDAAPAWIHRSRQK